MRSKLFAFALLTFAGTSGAWADDDHGGEHGHHRPPPEAFSACEKLKEGDSCAFKVADKQVAGKCKLGHREPQKLHCRPDGAPPAPPPAHG
jgi:hypothetical protein